MKFDKVDVKTIDKNVISLFDDNWALISAGTTEKGFNTMTASWGGLGKLWAKNVCFIFIRPQRYTLEFVDNNDTFSVSFFGSEYKKALAFCGRNSGRDVDKMKETGLIAFDIDSTIGFEQAQIVLTCKKLAVQDIDPTGFIDASVDGNYPDKDYHKMFVGEIISCYVEGNA